MRSWNPWHVRQSLLNIHWIPLRLATSTSGSFGLACLEQALKNIAQKTNRLH